MPVLLTACGVSWRGRHNWMVLFAKHYTDTDAKELLVATLAHLLADIGSEPLFLCVGSEKHILDCFGPLTGTMLCEREPGLVVYGTLDKPLHAKNLSREVPVIKEKHSGKIVVAIDASVGKEEELGMIKVKNSPLIPGKALARRLPPVGDLSIIGIVGMRLSKKDTGFLNSGSLTHVYHMAKLIAEAVYEWSQKKRKH